MRNLGLGFHLFRLYRCPLRNEWGDVREKEQTVSRHGIMWMIWERAYRNGQSYLLQREPHHLHSNPKQPLELHHYAKRDLHDKPSAKNSFTEKKRLERNRGKRAHASTRVLANINPKPLAPPVTTHTLPF